MDEHYSFAADRDSRTNVRLCPIFPPPCDELLCTLLVLHLTWTTEQAAATKFGTQFSSLICVEDTSELADRSLSPSTQRWVTRTSSHSCSESASSMMSSWLRHINRDRLWPQGGSAGCRPAKGPEDSSKMSLSFSVSDRTQVGYISGWSAANHSRCVMLIWMLQGGCLQKNNKKRAHGLLATCSA